MECECREAQAETTLQAAHVRMRMAMVRNEGGDGDDGDSDDGDDSDGDHENHDDQAGTTLQAIANMRLRPDGDPEDDDDV